MGISCIFKSPRDMCRAVLELYNSPKDKKRLFAIQYNRFLTESTTWWLSPVGANPAYKYGKFGFVPSGEGEITIGLCVEKGLGRESQCPSTQIMDSTWFWHTFLNEIETERFTSALNSIRSAAGTKPELYIESSIGSEKDSISFLWESPNGQLSCAMADVREVLSGLTQVPDLRSLAEFLRELTYRSHDGAFVWIDFIIGIRCRLGGATSDSWDEWAIVRNFLQHLEPWVR